MSLNPNLTYFVERLQGVSTNTFRLETQNRDTAVQNDIVSFSLPSNAILNLRSLKVWCNATANLNAGAVSGARLPPIDDLVERVEVSVGGVILSQGTNFQNVLNEAFQATQVQHTDSVVGHPEYVRAVSYVDGSVYTGAANENYAAGASPRFCIQKFHGFLASADPKLLDTSIIPDIQVRLYMASDNVLTTSAGVAMGSALAIAAAPAVQVGFARAGGAGGGRYQLTNLHATIEAIGLASSEYDQMLNAQMSQQGFLEIPYKGYNSFAETHSGASRFTVSTQSLDRVWVSWRKTDYNSQAEPLIVNGYKKEGAFINGAHLPAATAAAATPGTTIDLGLPQYDIGGVLGTNSEKYKSQYFNFAAPQTNLKMQLQLNGAYMPQFSATLGDVYGITRNSLPAAREAKEMSLDQYINNYCVQCFRLNLPDSEYSRSISGLDTRAVNLQGIVKTENFAAGGGRDNLSINIWCETTEVLRVGAGRSIEIIS
tara:strand:- start:1781 stop:3235 length:1455 start_codon:yes stop_codon:yes gene_type:complete